MCREYYSLIDLNFNNNNKIIIQRDLVQALGLARATAWD